MAEPLDATVSSSVLYTYGGVHEYVRSFIAVLGRRRTTVRLSSCR